ncbi:hypothetical protein O7606_15870 [Micromonospora sp. WMMD882]|uniref:hypothetical protein n=1 Tax=Micromonospora sp. WMMD882 TaxID=3015151 RepID=UPI00248B753D|nr:hypothetical protein [Micromonospora sp. WMMD882]WBB77747.1 hypothetical protein O7606_15870 [Micromonospora sp. WMMD882]
MTGPRLSLAQIRNRMILTARTVLRQHRPDQHGDCRLCRTRDCRVASAARAVLRAAGDGDPGDQGGAGSRPG